MSKVNPDVESRVDEVSAPKKRQVSDKIKELQGSVSIIKPMAPTAVPKETKLKPRAESQPPSLDERSRSASSLSLSTNLKKTPLLASCKSSLVLLSKVTADDGKVQSLDKVEESAIASNPLISSTIHDSLPQIDVNDSSDPQPPVKSTRDLYSPRSLSLDFGERFLKAPDDLLEQIKPSESSTAKEARSGLTGEGGDDVALDSSEELEEDPNLEQIKPSESSSSRSSKRKLICMEILTTEIAYVQHLKTLDELYYTPLLRLAQASESDVILTKAEIQLLFSNLSLILALNTKLRDDLLKKLEKSPWDEEQTTVGDVFTHFGHFFKMYKEYVLNHKKAEEWLQTASSVKRKKVHQFLSDCKNNPKCKGQTLSSYLIMPVQRIPRYRLLLEELKKATPDTHKDHSHLVKALDLIRQVAVEINEFVRSVDSQDAVAALQAKFKGGILLVKPGRRLIKHGILTKISKIVKQFHFFLFDDLLLCAAKSLTGYSAKRQIDFSPFTSPELFDIQDSIGEDEQYRFQIRLGDKSFVLRGDSQKEKDEWILALRPLCSSVTTVDFPVFKSLDSQSPLAAEDKLSCKICHSLFSMIVRKRICDNW
jgi:hypothetical protein